MVFFLLFLLCITYLVQKTSIHDVLSSIQWNVLLADELHCVYSLDFIAYSLGEASKFVSCQSTLLFLVPEILQELTVPEELACVFIEDRHCFMYFVLDSGNTLKKAAGLLAWLGAVTTL